MVVVVLVVVDVGWSSVPLSTNRHNSTMRAVLYRGDWSAAAAAAAAGEGGSDVGTQAE